MVTATMRGTSELIGLEIKPETVDPDDIEMLSDLVIAAVNAVLKKATDDYSAEMSKITGGAGFTVKNEVVIGSDNKIKP